MAVPPIPPRSGFMKSWTEGTESNIWGTKDWSNHLATSLSVQPNLSQRTDQDKQTPLATSYNGEGSRSSPPPPLPPRQWNRPMQTSKMKEINELLLVPPPPSGRNFQKHEDLIRFSGISQDVQKSHSSAGLLFNSSNVNIDCTSQKVFFDNTKTSSTFLHTDQSKSVFYTQSNASGQLKVPYLNAATNDIQHSRSEPNLGNFLVKTGERQPIQARFNTLQKRSTRGAVESNLENVLNFMKKKRDSNLIDLYCGEDDMIKQCSNTQASKMFENDILKLFDPLSINIDSPFLDSVDETQLESNIETSFGGRIKSIISPTMPPEWNDDFSKKTFVDDVFETVDGERSKENCWENDPACSRIPELKVSKKASVCNSEIQDFCTRLIVLRSEFPYDDYHTNVGLVISPSIDSYREDTLSIKLVIHSTISDQPVSFTCDVNTSVEHIISHAICTIFDNISNMNMDDFVLKIYGLSEYFSADSVLANYEYVHLCHKFDKVVELMLIETKDLQRPLARTLQDDNNDINCKPESLLHIFSQGVISCDSVNILLDTLSKEVEKMKICASKLNRETLHPQGVIQAVKAICTLLCHIETVEITDAVESLIQVCLLFGKSEPVMELDLLVSKTNTSDTNSETKTKLLQLLNLALVHLHEAVNQLLSLYSQTFKVDFDVSKPPAINSPVKDISSFLDTLLFQIGLIHRIPPQWITLFEHFQVVCDMWHGENHLGVVETKTVVTSKSFFHRVLFDEWLQFETIPMCMLPREVRLQFTFLGLRMDQSDSKTQESNQQIKTVLGWCGIYLFNYQHELVQGSYLLGLWPDEVPKGSGPSLSNENSHCPLLQLNFPDFGCKVKFPVVIQNEFSSSNKRNFETLNVSIQSQLMEIIEHDPLISLTAEEKELIWEKRHYLYDIPRALPKVLLSAHGWDWACLSDIYGMLQEWKPLPPIEALMLLLPSFADIEVRRSAISWMKSIVSDELCDYLPQMVQALRYEVWEDSPLVWFLLERSLTSIRVAHHLYWLLQQTIDDPLAGERMHLILNALLVISGKAMRERIETQQLLLHNLSNVADSIKSTKESMRLNNLFHELEVAHHSLSDSPTCLPLTPSLEVCGIDVKSCSYFTSNTLPLKLVFRSKESNAKCIEAIYKVGDDLRQDMLTLQMIRIMDKMWLKEGLDLKIVTFMCIATAHKKGMVEMVLEAETLRKIQTEHGLTGSFKDRPIAEWLQKYNTSELEYQQAVENFTMSCAGYCVATYVLGICDRHNDNIMLKTSGHIFHIDFGKFLGDAQMFGNIKRDRTPFVLTSDMAYVINGGVQPTKRFQNFIDLCCQAFNIVRKNSNIFLNLFSLMVSSGIPGVTMDALGYVQKALLPGLSEAEATSHFTRMIEGSLKSWTTQFNFFMHNLAQLRFTGDHNDGLLLSFIPKLFTKETDGRLISVEVVGCQKRFDPDKYYVYIIKLHRENQVDPMYIIRSYREFVEFHQKMCMMFPLAKFHPLPRNPLMGRTNVREVAERRKVEIGIFLETLMEMADEISHCSIVYTFFHPILRDQEGMSPNLPSPDYKETLRKNTGDIRGQVKLSIVYKKKSFFVMVMHAKNLSSSKGNAPDAYVKIYLLPDPTKVTKRKTKVVFKNNHPTFMEMLAYSLPLDIVTRRTLHVSIWNYDRMQENEFLGAVNISLDEINIQKETVKWYQLGDM
ncbi:phosphatidylinositol 4-phosphate 3-kinase C2 domain-containing subunit alpha-like [Centruroides sculpturatus]|uniref:phosphatidylinositol 4-phosphate 3-kinase C2 domain-containing subunit alpha-like n=1 Tax=Centruroides sculpturatus TaxID=218467 RepID=UPI000C6D6DF6|nr:phosphatidylinositol 4-phosphate 3-kinase C2 domain-containing subunit alpha-like [Centruroides sculpturatus]XP_023217154.1 phosphatidylinositol 4-phosphate 3-kinase C2 domain-containing subunit alpha-like [Centruroides sculpturatus]XP_023217164.1 phosphatidylinositol 4-phosphate 3-kinase C2 domain-containing subunit alpha-like [Centruroides sculpturatus]XP_023217169.1 phosphatidylinositol 4-phosphate 3-kinase C2 domain-containing subunit alpha-like [Centruroides sculpturatus]